MTTNRWSYANTAGIQFGGAAAIITPHDLRGASHTDALRPTAALYATMSRVGSSLAGQALLTSGRMHLAALYLPTGTSLTSVSFFSGGTPATGPTHQWFALYDSSRILLKQTADDADAAWSGSVKKTLNLSRVVADAAISTGTATFTSATAAFTSGDVGKNVTVLGAGAAGVALGTTAAPVTILSVESATSCTLSANASTTVSAAKGYIAQGFTTTYDGLHYVGIMVAAGTVPNVIGITSFSSVVGQVPIVNGFADTTLTTTAPNPATTITSSNPVPYAWVS